MRVTNQDQREQIVSKIERIRKDLSGLATALNGELSASDILEAAKWLALAEAKMAKGTRLVRYQGGWRREG